MTRLRFLRLDGYLDPDTLAAFGLWCPPEARRWTPEQLGVLSDAAARLAGVRDAPDEQETEDQHHRKAAAVDAARQAVLARWPGFFWPAAPGRGGVVDVTVALAWGAERLHAAALIEDDTDLADHALLAVYAAHEALEAWSVGGAPADQDRRIDEALIQLGEVLADRQRRGLVMLLIPDAEARGVVAAGAE